MIILILIKVIKMSLKILLETNENAKGMRNLIVHEYGKIDDEIVFEAITKELIKDANKFLGEISKSL